MENKENEQLSEIKESWYGKGSNKRGLCLLTLLIMLEQKRINNMWLVPFKGRNSSSTYEQNFLWTNDNVYIMDNHRAALWCWFRHISEDSKVSLIHIDRHTDTLCSKIDDWVNKCPNLMTITIDDYLGFIHKGSMGSNIQ